MLFLLSSLALSLTLVTPAQATEADMWECPSGDGSVVYTNKATPECRAISLPPLSVIESRPALPDRTRQTFSVEPSVVATAPVESGQERICTKYFEWIDLNERTTGGLYFRSFGDNTRFATLQKVFGGGGTCPLDVSSRMLKQSTSGVLAALRGAPRTAGCP
jgi:hypothetical protein